MKPPEDKRMQRSQDEECEDVRRGYRASQGEGGVKCVVHVRHSQE